MSDLSSPHPPDLSLSVRLQGGSRGGGGGDQSEGQNQSVTSGWEGCEDVLASIHTSIPPSQLLVFFSGVFRP